MIGFALFALGYVGGGDAKLFAATLLWLGLRDLMPYVLIASIAGGVLTLIMLALAIVPATTLRQLWIVKLHDPRSGIPYGVAWPPPPSFSCRPPEKFVWPQRFNETLIQGAEVPQAF